MAVRCKPAGEAESEASHGHVWWVASSCFVCSDKLWTRVRIEYVRVESGSGWGWVRVVRQATKVWIRVGSTSERSGL